MKVLDSIKSQNYLSYWEKMVKINEYLMHVYGEGKGDLTLVFM